MTVDDIDKVMEVELLSFSVPWPKDAFFKEVQDNKFAYYTVAERNGEIVGYAGLWHIVNEGHITNIAVHPDYRRQGIAQMLLDDQFRLAREREMIGVTLEVRVHNERAQRLYTKNGFKMEGIRKNYYSDTHEDALIMWKHF